MSTDFYRGYHPYEKPYLELQIQKGSGYRGTNNPT
ncbi:MAG: hypothetical protein BWY63_00324 [Chloroflexi bacterium ADurb.Bin360]|nr:MAG: hypothetical protein BWY63_00324 [Chloroflexi bacterium ADurb.Bin360]